MQGKNLWGIGVLWATIACGIMTSPAVAEDAYLIRWEERYATQAYEYPMGVAVGPWHNVYVAGHVEGAAGEPNYQNQDATLTKFTADGDEIWRREFGTSELDSALAVAVDSSGNIYVTGQTAGNFTGGSAGLLDMILVKFDSNGNEIWRRQYGTAGDESGQSVAVDASGNIFVTGHSSGHFFGLNMGGVDTFLAKFNADGVKLWSRLVGTEGEDHGLSVALDAEGSAYIAGKTSGPLGGVHWGGNDAFLVKFDANGTQQWAQQVGSASDDVGAAVVVVPDGPVCVAGNTDGDLGGFNAGEYDMFLARFHAEGHYFGSRQYGTNEDDFAYAAAVDRNGAILIAGSTDGNFTGEDPGNMLDACLMKVDFNGNEIWRRYTAQGGKTYCHGVAVDAANDAYIIADVRHLVNSSVFYRDTLITKFSGCVLDSLPGDVNSDGVVDLDDFTIFKTGFGKVPAALIDGDASGDGKVDLDDFVLIVRNFGRTVDDDWPRSN